MAEKTGMTAMIRKWVGLTAGIFVQSLGGGGLCFSNYSPLVKSVLNLNQVQLNNVGVAKDFGENIGLLSGYVCDLLPPGALLLIGAAEGLIGYGMLYLVLTGRIAPLPYWQVTLLLCLAANSATWYNTAVLVTSMRNFPKSRGRVVGIVKGFVGLSGAIFTQIFVALLKQDQASFVLLLAVAPLVMTIVTMYFIRPVSSPTGDYDPEEDGGFLFIYIVCVGLAVYLFVISMTENAINLSPLTGRIVIAIMVVFLCSPLAVPAKFLVDKYFRGGRKGFRGTDNNREPLLVKEASIEREEEPSAEAIAAKERFDLKEQARLEKSTSMCLYPSPELDGEEDPHTMLAVGEGAVRRKRKGPRRGEDFTLAQALVKADFWLLFITFFCGVGTGVTAINNMGQIGQAQGLTNATVYVSLFSICNFLGRLGGGTISEHYVRLSAMPRTAVMMVAQVLMIIGHLMFAAAIYGSMLVGSILLGCSYGVHYTVMVPTASELFGLRDFGMIYNFITIGSPVASLLFSGIIAGYFYDREAAKTGTSTCVGSHCFRVTFLVMAGVCLIGLLANVLLTLRIKPVYRSLYGATVLSSRTGSYQTLPPNTDKNKSPRSPRAIGHSSHETLTSQQQRQQQQSDGSYGGEEGIH